MAQTCIEAIPALRVHKNFAWFDNSHLGSGATANVFRGIDLVYSIESFYLKKTKLILFLNFINRLQEKTLQ
jgi:hypothetical protein